MERTLNERFLELESRMISVDALTKYGTANDLKFYIFDYNPKDEIKVRNEIVKIKNRNPQIIEFDLYEMMLEVIEESGYSGRLEKMEQRFDKNILLRQILQPLLSIEHNDGKMMSKFKNRIPDDGNYIALITGVGKAYPIIRSHTILNNLQSVFRQNPVVMMYPGRYEIKYAMTLKLFERLDDDNYYRAFPLVERRINNHEN